MSVEEMIRFGCGQRHYLQALGTEKDRPLDGGTLLLRRAHENMKGILAHHFKQALADVGFKTLDPILLAGFVRLDAFGLLEGDRLVDLHILPPKSFSPNKPPRWAMLAAAVKADALGLTKATVICMDQNTQVWSFWNVAGSFASLGEMVSSEVHHIAGALEGLHEPLASADGSTCVTCPFKGSCNRTDLLGDPEAYDVRDLRTRPNHELESAIEGYLWSLNQKEDGRKKGVIHPSEISTSECDRKIAYGLLATEEQRKVDPKLRLIFDMGHAIHDAVQHVLKRALDGFRDEVSFSNAALKMAGSCDGVRGEDGYEFKSISEGGYEKLSKQKKEHEQQATIYAANLELSRVKYLYISKGNGDIAEYPVPVNRKVWHRVATRAENIVKTVNEGDMPPKIDKNYICKKCKYAWTCRPETVERSTALPGGFNR